MNSKSGNKIVETDFGTYAIPESVLHRPAAKSILSNKIWEEDTINTILEGEIDYPEFGSNLVTAGAFFGDMIPLLGGHFKEIFAFEPNPQSYSALWETIRLNSLEDKVSPIKMGLSDSSRLAKLKTKTPDGKDAGGASKVIDKSWDTYIPETEDIVLMSLDDWYLGNMIEFPISVIHLDVEGNENEVLMGAQECIKKFRPTLILERIPDTQFFRDVILGEFGYQYSYKIDSNYLFKVYRRSEA